MERMCPPKDYKAPHPAGNHSETLYFIVCFLFTAWKKVEGCVQKQCRFIGTCHRSLHFLPLYHVKREQSKWVIEDTV